MTGCVGLRDAADDEKNRKEEEKQLFDGSDGSGTGYEHNLAVLRPLSFLSFVRFSYLRGIVRYYYLCLHTDIYLPIMYIRCVLLQSISS